MTNREKFIEIFHAEPITNHIPFDCRDIKCSDCDANGYGCDALAWWDSEYKENKE